MKVLLNRKTIVRLYCLFSEAERSVHRLLDPASAWPEFQQYYSPPKKELLRQALETLSGRLPKTEEEMPPYRKEDVIKALHAPGLFHFLFGRWSARWKTSWRFSLAEIQWLARTVGAFLACLEKEDKPDAHLLIAMRRDFFTAAAILEYRCVGMAEIKRFQPIAHFRQTQWLKTVPVDVFLDDAA